MDKSQSSQVINYEVQPKWEAEEPKPTLKCQNIDSNFREKLRNFIEFWRRIFLSKKSYYLGGVTWPKANKMSTISLKLQARPRTAPSTRDRKIGRLSRSDSQISLTSSIGTGQDSRTVWLYQAEIKGPGTSEKGRIVGQSRHKTRIYRLHPIVRQVLIRRWVRIKFYGTFVDQSFRYAI